MFLFVFLFVFDSLVFVKCFDFFLVLVFCLFDFLFLFLQRNSKVCDQGLAVCSFFLRTMTSNLIKKEIQNQQDQLGGGRKGVGGMEGNQGCESGHFKIVLISKTSINI